MKILTAFLIIVFLLPVFVTAQTGESLGPSCASNYQKLPVREFPQKFGTSWCWAATSQSVMDYKGNNVNQCELVAKVYSYRGTTPCCGSTVTECWGLGGYPEWAFDASGFSYLPSKDDVSHLNWTTATEEICQDRPFITARDIIGGDRHSVVVSGYWVENGERYLRIYDPAEDGYSYEPPDEFFTQSPWDIHVRDTYNIVPVP